MYVVDRGKFETAMQAQGYRTLGELAESLGIHRNTLHYYLSGRPLLPKQFERVMAALKLDPGDILVPAAQANPSPQEAIAPLIDQLHAEFPDVTFVLFGSRLQRRAHRYSDWDIGVYRNGELPHAQYRQIVQRAKELAEDGPYVVDVINLNRADAAFLREISSHWTFLTGRRQDWIELQGKAAA